MADLLGIGEHCSVPECRLRDFLPFTCDCCQKVYCLEHRTYASHFCEKARGNEHTTIVCPLCARLITISENEDPNEKFEEHTTKACDPSNYARVNQKRRCPVKGCKEKLTSVNTYKCKECHQDVCLKHRLATDHQCVRRPDPRRPNAGQSVLSRLLNGTAEAGPSPVSSRVVEGRSNDANLLAAASSLWSRFKGNDTAQKIPRNADQKRPVQTQNVEKTSRTTLTSQAAEICPTCNVAFDTVAELIAHCQLHQSNLPGEVCPQCQVSFKTIPELISHVERQHLSPSACVVN